MTAERSLYLIGPRGSGKTTLGRLIATACDVPFIDLDERALALFAEPTITAVWRERGEPAWREAETAALGAVIEQGPQVVALGGGTPMIEAARTMLEAEQQAGRVVVVYLKRSIAELMRRLEEEGGDRPSLTGQSLLDEIAPVLRQREPTYEQLADAVFTSDEADPKAEAEQLARLVS